MSIKKNDFIELDYTGIVLGDGILFDTTDKDVAKKGNMYNPKMAYEPAIICVGQNQLLKGLDKDVEGKEIGKEYQVKITPEDGFGKKSAKLIQLIPTAKFTKDKIRPAPGLQVNIDNSIGVIKTVTGGRVMVDFNHPLSGKDLSYSYRVKRIVNDDLEKVDAYMKLAFNLPVKSTIKEGTVEIEIPFKLPDSIVDEISTKFKEIINNKLNYVFVEKKANVKKPSNE